MKGKRKLTSKGLALLLAVTTVVTTLMPSTVYASEIVGGDGTVGSVYDVGEAGGIVGADGTTGTKYEIDPAILNPSGSSSSSSSRRSTSSGSDSGESGSALKAMPRAAGSPSGSYHAVNSNARIAKVFKGTRTYDEIKSVSFGIYGIKGEDVGYTVKVYQNLRNESEPDSGVLVYSGTENRKVYSSALQETLTENLSSSNVVSGASNVVVESGESYGVVIEFSSDDDNYIIEGASSTDCYEDNGYSSWDEGSNSITVSTASTNDTGLSMSGAKVTLSPATQTIDISDTLQLSATLTPSFKRNLTYTASDSSVATVDTNGLVTPAGTGTVTITASVGVGGTNTNIVTGTKTLNIVSASLAATSYTYQGKTIAPVPTISFGAGSLLEGTDYSLSYSDGGNTVPGVASVTVTGTSTGKIPGYSKTLEYEVTSGAITQAMVDAASYSINNSTKEVSVTGLKDGSNELVQGTHFTAEITSVSATKYTIKITGKGGYTGSFTREEAITPSSTNKIDISKFYTATLEYDEIAYSAKANKPGYTLWAGDTNITETLKSAVTVTYKDNTEVGTGSVIIKARDGSNYTGSITKTFTITKLDIESSSNIKVSVGGNTSGTLVEKHTGAAITPTVEVTLEEEDGTAHELIQGTDYRVMYTNNTLVGNASVYIVALDSSNSFEGAITTGFTIIDDFSKEIAVRVGKNSGAYDANNSNGYQSSYSADYTGAAITPSVNVRINGGRTLTAGVDYKSLTAASYSNNIKAGNNTAKITIEGMGKYDGEVVEVTFSIGALKEFPAKLTVSPSTYTYTTAAIEPTSVSLGSLKEGEDYELSYDSNINVGTATVTATGKGNYAGASTQATYNIEPLSLSATGITIDSVADMPFTGAELKPTPSVYYNGTRLDTFSKLTYSYENNKDVSTTSTKAKVIVKGSNNFTGEVSTNFNITKKAFSPTNLTFTIDGETATKGADGNLWVSREYSYNGTSHKPDSILVQDNGVELRAGTDYRLNVANTVEVGKAYISFTGLNNYAGSNVKVYFTITPRTVEASNRDLTVTVSPTSSLNAQGYYAPTITIVDDGIKPAARTLSEGTGATDTSNDYYITYDDSCKTSGTGKKLTIHGINNYTGEREITFDAGTPINDASIKLANPNTGDEYTYKSAGTHEYELSYIGMDKDPVYTLTLLDSTVLTSADYDVTYTCSEPSYADTAGTYNHRKAASNSTPNVVTVTFTGKGLYYGTKTARYMIKRAIFDDTVNNTFEITNSAATATKTSTGDTIIAKGNPISLNETAIKYFYDYDGSEIDLSTIALTFAPKSGSTISLVKDVDYKLLVNGAETSKLPATIGTYKISITGIGNYEGTKANIECEVKHRVINDSMISFSNPAIDATFKTPYTGEVIDPGLVVKDGSRTLELNKDYKVAYLDASDPTDTTSSSRVEAGAVKVLVTGQGNYSGSGSKTFTITKIDISKAEVADIINPVYNAGKPVEPSRVTLTYNGKTLVAPRDFTFVSDKDYNPGKHNINITGAGNYTGTKTVPYYILACLTDTNQFTKDVSGLTTTYDVGTSTIKGDIQFTYTAHTYTADGSIASDETKQIKIPSFSATLDTSIPGDSYIEINGIGASGDKDYDVNNGFVPTVTFSTIKIPIKVNGNLGSDKIQVSNLDAVYYYTGEQIKPEPYVTFTSGTTTRVLSNGVDYTLEYGANRTGGTASGSVNIIGAGSYSGSSVAKTFNITYNLNDAKLKIKKGDEEIAKNVPYTGSPYTDASGYSVEVSINGHDISSLKGSVFDITWGDNTEAGLGTVSIKPTSSAAAYAIGQASTSFNITGKSIVETSVTLDGMASNTLKVPYTGQPIKPVVEVTDGVNTLVENTDYRVNWYNNTRVGTTARAQIVGMKNYTGSQDAYFEIEASDIAKFDTTDFDVSDANYAGDKGAIPIVVITHEGTTLVEGTDYTCEYSGNKAISTPPTNQATVTITGKGNYKGTRTVKYNVVQTDLGNGSITFDKNTAEFTGAEIDVKDLEIEVYCPVGGSSSEKYKLKKSTDGTSGDYTISLASGSAKMKDQGVYTIIIEGMNGFKNQLSTTFTITPRSIPDREDSTKTAANIEIVIADQPHDGKAKTPTVTITDTGRADTKPYTLVEGTDFTVTYLNNTNAGDAADEDLAKRPTARIVGKGNYEGTYDAYFNIGKPISDSDEIIITDDIPVVAVGESGHAYVYDGTKHKPTVTVTTKDGTVLRKDKDYTVEYEALDDVITNANIKTTEVHKSDDPAVTGPSYKVIGMGDYYGVFTKDYTINQKEITDKSIFKVELNLPKDADGNYYFVYDGAGKEEYAVEPDVKIYDTQISAKKTVDNDPDYGDYYVTYKNNVGVTTEGNKALAQIHFRNNYKSIGTDTLDVPFIIKEKTLDDKEGSFYVNLVNGGKDDSFVWTGEEIDDSVIGLEVYYEPAGAASPIKLNPETDYDFSFLKDPADPTSEPTNINAGTATVTVTGKGNYSGSLKKDFTITADLSTADVEIPDQCYTGTAVEPDFEVECGGNKLIKGVDYDVTYTSADNYQTVGTASITPLNKYYSGTKAADYKIVFDESKVEVGIANEVTYTGKIANPVSYVRANGKAMAPGTYTIDYLDSKGAPAKNITDVTGEEKLTAAVTVTLGKKKVVKTGEFKIIPRQIGSCRISLVSQETYTGLAKEPPIAMVYETYGLKSGKDYTVTYTNNVNPGVAIATIKGIGNFTGTITRQFEIVSPKVYNLKGFALSDSSVKLEWTKNPYVTGYEIYRTDGVKMLDRVGYTGNGYLVIAGLSPQTSNTYAVRSYVIKNGKATYGVPSMVTVMTSVAVPVVTTESKTQDTATISWDPTVKTITGYEINRCDTIAGTYYKIAFIPTSLGSYTDGDVISKNTYYYKVRAYVYDRDNQTFYYSDYSGPFAVTIK